jgi:hypothetical protein
MRPGRLGLLGLIALLACSPGAAPSASTLDVEVTPPSRTERGKAPTAHASAATTPLAPRFEVYQNGDVNDAIADDPKLRSLPIGGVGCMRDCVFYDRVSITAGDPRALEAERARFEPLLLAHVPPSYALKWLSPEPFAPERATHLWAIFISKPIVTAKNVRSWRISKGANVDLEFFIDDEGAAAFEQARALPPPGCYLTALLGDRLFDIRYGGRGPGSFEVPVGRHEEGMKRAAVIAELLAPLLPKPEEVGGAF